MGKATKVEEVVYLANLEEDIEASLQGFSGGLKNLAEERHLK
jgi:hypothetical protein